MYSSLLVVVCFLLLVFYIFFDFLMLSSVVVLCFVFVFEGVHNNGRLVRVYAKMTSNLDGVIIKDGKVAIWSCSIAKRMEVEVVGESGVDAVFEVWRGAKMAPYKMRVYMSEETPFRFVFGAGNVWDTLAIRNLGDCGMVAKVCVTNGSLPVCGSVSDLCIVGGGVRQVGLSFEENSVCAWTDGCPLNARMEITSKDETKQIIEVYAEDGRVLPFVGVLCRRASEEVVRLINTGSSSMFGCVGAAKKWE